MNYIINNDDMENIRSLSIYDDVATFRDALNVALQDMHLRYDAQFVRDVDERTIHDIMNITNIEDDVYRANFTHYFDRINYLLIYELFVERRTYENQ